VSIDWDEFHKEYDLILNHLKSIKHNKKILWAYINLQEDGSFGWILTREYRIAKINKDERIKSIMRQAYSVYMANRAILLRSLS